jgi:trehalose 6-phosphate phosphatase
MMLDLKPDRCALFLDFDGTLVDIAPRPEAVRVPEGLPSILARVADRFGGALALVSGRPISELDAFLDPLRLPAFGLHGLERRRGDRIEQAEPPAALAEIRAAVQAALGASRGVRVEDKGLAIALHYREVPALEDPIRAFATALAAPYPDISVMNGKMVAEIKPRFASKAVAVEALMAEPPFAGRRPVYVGDDVTDEDGMRAALALGGVAVKVGAGETVAPHRVDGPADVRAWLARLSTE